MSFRVRGKLLTHGLAFSVAGSSEVNSERLVLACTRAFRIRSFWDIGSNIGYYAWLIKSAAPDVELVLLEPLRENAELIRETIGRHGFADATLIVAGASDTSGEAILHADRIAGATSSLEEAERTFEERHMGVASKEVKVRIVSVDEAQRGHRPIDLMKIDVEGHEAAVLRGTRETIRRDQPLILIECWHAGHPCLAGLESCGYRIVDADHLRTDCSAHRGNFFCFPGKYADRVETLLQVAGERSVAA